MISRRTFALLLVCAATKPSVGGAQQNPNPAPATRIWRIGVLARERVKDHLLRGLWDLGYEPGKNLLVDHRPLDRPEMLPRFAADFVALSVDVIVAGGTQAVRAAQQATQHIPIITTGSSDPVGSGLVASLARPGGNITGLSLLNPELSGKRLELLKEIVGDISPVAVLWNPDDPPAGTALAETETAARALGVTVRSFEIRRGDDVEPALESARDTKPKAVVILSAPVMTLNLRRIAAWAVDNRLPSVFWDRSFPEAGGLISYGPDQDTLARRAALFVDKVFKGAKPADLPIEQPTKFDLVINLKTAKALGLNVPQSLLLRADETID